MNGRLLYFFAKSFLKKTYRYDCVIIKGEALSMTAYGKEGLRSSTDIDILTPRNNLSKIEELLLNDGYVQEDNTRKSRIFCLSNSHQIIPFTKKIDVFKISIDVNFDVFWGEYSGKRIDVADFISNPIVMPIYGCQVKTLSPLKAFVHLVLHHYKDMNSIYLLATERCFTIDKFKDIYNILKNNATEISLDKLYSISVKYEIVPYVYYVLYYTGQVFDDEILRRYIEAFRTPEGEALLNCYGLCSKEQKEWKCDFKTRLESENLYNLIKDDLTERDKEKIAINRRIFLGESE